MDDILVWGADQKQHDERLEKVLKRAREQNLKLNAKKCKFGVSEVKYIGHTLTAKGLKPDEKKVQAVQEMHKPHNKKELQQFLGMVNYLGKFVPQLSNVTQPLRQLLEKSAEWQWHTEHDKSFEELQRLVTEAPVLQYFDVTNPVRVSVDASSTGVAVL